MILVEDNVRPWPDETINYTRQFGNLPLESAGRMFTVECPHCGSKVTFKDRGEHFAIFDRRIVYRWEHGSWNEWYISPNDRRSGWLSEAASIEYWNDDSKVFIGSYEGFDTLYSTNLRELDGW